MTQRLLFLENLSTHWKLYGKTGSGSLVDQDGAKSLNRRIGWFVGWIQKKNRKIVFAYLIEDDEKKGMPASVRARSAAIKLLKTIDKR